MAPNTSIHLPGPALTAVGVALIRARETRRIDALYRDPLAQRFVDAAEQVTSPEQWQRVHAVAEVMYDSRTIGVRIVDDCLLTAVRDGSHQVVLLGAGLDTHAFRLPWPQRVDLFEIDLPELFAFKDRVLADAATAENCRRHTVAVDLSGDWVPALLAAGFTPTRPTCWIDHVSVSLPQQQALRLAAEVTELSSRGSQYSFPAMTTAGIEQSVGRIAGARELYRGQHSGDRERGLGSAGIAQLSAAGWRIDRHPLADIAAAYGRGEVDEQGAMNVVASR